MTVLGMRLVKMVALGMPTWDITEEWKEKSHQVDRKIQRLLEPDRVNGKIGVKFNFPDAKVRIRDLT